MSEEYDHPKGGEQGYEGDGPNIRYDDFVQRIVQNPNNPPKVTLLSGFLGSSSEEGHVRLYLDEELGRYVEIPEKAIRHTQELPPEQSPLGGSLVWIDSNTEVLHGAAGSQRRKATFLEGLIEQDYISGGGFGLAGGGGSITTQTRECRAAFPTIVGADCGRSLFSPCIPQTEVLICRTKTGIACTRFGPDCRRTIFEPACLPRFFPQADFGGVGADAQGFTAFPLPTIVCTRNISCQSRVNAACFSIFPPDCVLGLVSRDLPCPPPTTTGLKCDIVSRVNICADTRTHPACVVGTANCQTFDPGCQISQVAICDTRVCGVVSAVCGFDPAHGGGAQQVEGPEFNMATLTGRECITGPLTGCYEMPTRSCTTYGTVCTSALDARPTRYKCPTRFGCSETRLCGGQSVACFPGGFGGGF